MCVRLVLVHFIRCLLAFLVTTNLRTEMSANIWADFDCCACHELKEIQLMSQQTEAIVPMHCNQLSTRKTLLMTCWSNWVKQTVHIDCLRLFGWDFNGRSSSSSVYTSSGNWTSKQIAFDTKWFVTPTLTELLFIELRLSSEFNCRRQLSWAQKFCWQFSDQNFSLRKIFPRFNNVWGFGFSFVLGLSWSRSTMKSSAKTCINPWRLWSYERTFNIESCSKCIIGETFSCARFEWTVQRNAGRDLRGCSNALSTTDLNEQQTFKFWW